MPDNKKNNPRAPETRLHPTEQTSSQRGLSWLEWFGEKSTIGRRVTMFAFIALVIWMAIARWGACLSS